MKSSGDSYTYACDVARSLDVKLLKQAERFILALLLIVSN